MDKKWLKELNPSAEEQSKIDNWIKYNGLDRFRYIFDIVKKSGVILNYDRITECAKYDARVSQWCFKTIRILEGHFRAMILNYGDNYKEQINKKLLYQELTRIISKADCEKLNLFVNKYINKHDPSQEITKFTSFLDKLMFSELIELVQVLPKKELDKTDIFKKISNRNLSLELEFINLLRNDIMHNRLILKKSYKNKGISIVVKLLLSFVDDEDMRKRRRRELNGYGEYIIEETGEHRIIPDYYRISVCE